MKELRYMYSTHSFGTIIVDGKKKTIMYTTVVTPSGEITESEWIKLIEKQAKDKLELEILYKLKLHALDNLAWINTEKDAYEYALRLYSSRIWEDREWVGYETFNIELNKISEVEQISLF